MGESELTLTKLNDTHEMIHVGYAAPPPIYAPPVAVAVAPAPVMYQQPLANRAPLIVSEPRRSSSSIIIMVVVGVILAAGGDVLFCVFGRRRRYDRWGNRRWLLEENAEFCTLPDPVSSRMECTSDLLEV